MKKARVDYLSICLSWLLKISMFSTLFVFFVLIGFIFYKGVMYLSWDLFAWEYTSENVSMMPAIINTINMVLFSLLIALPLGIFGAIFLSEYGNKKSRLLNLIRVASDTLVGIPSIVYGLFGYLAFVIYFGFRTSFIAGVLTLSIMILPLILRSSEEALRSVPMSFREASFALGAGKLRTIFAIIVPAAIPGILAGVILSIGRIVGESAALLYTSGSVAKVAGVMDSGRTLSVHMYAISSEGQHINQAYSTAMILILIVLVINIASNLIAKKLTKGSL
ncbi:phosphate ABC transporter permease PstA [Helicobacter pullorum]|uniref:Phosphate transport system permease protein PstA n=1 Tax=Helicobacter pullorum MIT 98-5489 TaxID=537972 RepID=C5F0Z0_9HELI|nr:phosphate ABC transporter permease PstA [Helicobacter pullorum]EEQ63894.1 phosphate ABC transporter, permease protein PstA [Helicobacter pullorum MIT 98-5489]KAB0574805.1 phosphate ABC transporter permease PstA [Helicobacter pullorum NCTC 12824]KPH51952.1 phosphate ABC transporter permease [Helicobacter pullorum]KPH52787.1 phosphate ABC transporter permease [Helicobacter pullorum]OCR03706.1 phosphate ABC transporter, permease protein PstA [Helicobacter pullorum]